MQKLLNQIPRLRAEDALHASNVMAVGSGVAKNAKEMRRAWERAAGSDAGPRTWSSNLPALAAMGIDVVKEPRG